MLTEKVNIYLPKELLELLDVAAENLDGTVRRAMAIQLYLEEKISVAKASELAGMSLEHFESYLSQKRISISLLDFEDVTSDLNDIL